MKETETLFNNTLFIKALPVGFGVVILVAGLVFKFDIQDPYDRWWIGSAASIYAFVLTVIALNFRSEQTYNQLQETLKQNIFSNYLDHKNQFNIILDQIKTITK